MSSLCPNKDRCGSCAWSHIPYEKQLKQKLSDINGSFKLKKLGERVFEILPSPQTEHYRNRMDFVIDFEGRVGMREKGKWWKVIDNHVCFLGMERIEELFMMVRDWTKTAGLSFYDRKAGTGLLRYAVIRATTTDEAMVIIVTSKPELGERETLRKTLDLLTTSMTSTTSLIHSVNETISDVSFGTQLETISGSGFMEEVIADCRFRMTPNAFFQTNPYAAPMLLNTVREFAGDLSGKTVLDLYCGSGFFGIGLARFHLTSTEPVTIEAPKGCLRLGTNSESLRFGISRPNDRQPDRVILAGSHSVGRASAIAHSNHGGRARIIGVELVPEAIQDARVNAELNSVGVKFYEAKTEDFDWGQYKADVVILDPPRMGLHDKALADILCIKPETIVYVSCNYKNFARELVLLCEIYHVEAMRAIDMFPHTPHVELVTKLVRK
ncbi:TPA: hypothetical protein DDZ10_00760 [Candidatus Uhrbacteria bacterium]|nr:hypothetical protein [Candidatus Uhrbacteria bacterium]